MKRSLSILLPIFLTTGGTVAGVTMMAAMLFVGPSVEAEAVKNSSTARERINSRRAELATVHTWAVQFRHLDAAQIQGSQFDMIVVDHAPHPDQSTETPFSRKQVEALKHKADGGRRLVIAYLSIGEAESYRYYWKPEWQSSETRPSWLGAENPEWPGNYLVTFTDPEWQSIIFGTPNSYLDHIMAAGFDGVYLDRADAFQDEGHDTAETEDAMVSYLLRLADHAHRKDPGFLVIMQNAEELVRFAALRERLDGLAKEDLLYGGQNNSAEPNSPEMVRDSLAYLRKARRAGLSIFLLSYVNEAAKVEHVQKVARREGFRLYLAERLLDRLNLGGGATPPTSSDNQPETPEPADNDPSP
ncbi:MAG: endo alpha-1,4 polygalactosaminidase [Hyphomicrobiaceae bacterium]